MMSEYDFCEENFEPLQKLISTLEELDDVETDFILHAKDFAKKYHSVQKRKSGEPFYFHSIEVALILLELTHDQQTIIAALLHDGVEDTKLYISQIGLIFGNRVKFLVDRLTKLDNDVKKFSLAPHENINKLTRYQEEDVHVAYVKLADRTHNMRTISHINAYSKRRRISEETLKLYVPLARYLKLTSFERELETLSFNALNDI